MAGKNDYGFNAEEAINSLRPDTPKRQSREICTEESHETIAAAPKSEAAPTQKKASEKRSGKTVPVDEYMEWLKGKTDFNTRAGKSCNIRNRYHYRIAKFIGLLGDKDLSISTYIDMVLGEHLKKYEEAMDVVMKQKFNEMQELISNEE
ncbi:MAG: DUF3408 domain-containing protein [Prevotella sp.]|nr:DUF3408 domain-containing protein [Prevotella sp.]